MLTELVEMLCSVTRAMPADDVDDDVSVTARTTKQRETDVDRDSRS